MIKAGSCCHCHRHFPDLPGEKYRVLRNSSLDGARKVLLDHSQLAEAKELLENIYCVHFASIPDFLVRMQAAKFIPHSETQQNTKGWLIL